MKFTASLEHILHNRWQKMDTFLSRKRPKLTSPSHVTAARACHTDEDDTDIKLATLASLFPNLDHFTLLETLITTDGSVEEASKSLAIYAKDQKTSGQKVIGYQSSLHSAFGLEKTASKATTKKGQTLHLYSPEDIAAHTPCSIIHNFLPPEEANDLLRELLAEAPTYGKQPIKMFENIVWSPHTASFYVENLAEKKKHQTEYLYQGGYLTDIREILPQMKSVSSRVEIAVNREVEKRIKTHYPEGKKLKFQTSERWKPNCAFVNCYDGGKESVGYHSDQLTYVGPRAVIGSISLGVAREFRVRKIVAQDENDGNNKTKDVTRADAQGQIAIHLPHNSLLVMHAEMQEEWKHSIAPAPTIDPHPIAGNKRINITYRWYREPFHPRHTPKCHCNLATVLRCVQRKAESRGRYIWTCHAGNAPGKTSCSYFSWAEFDDDGNPPWALEEEESIPPETDTKTG